MASISIPFMDEDDCFFFESDHLALRGNKDYCEVLKTLVILLAQREQLIKDYNKVNELRHTVLDDTNGIINKLKTGEDLGIHFPGMIELPKIPTINFANYNVRVPESDLNDIYSNSTNCREDISTIEEELKKHKEKSKYDNYNVWSADEQKKLEELLLKYPPEPIERRRFQKIANELGTRSVSQVASRIQKYFLKLYKAGLPIPGRIPKSSEKYKKSFLHKHQRYNHYLWKPTTFFPKFDPPVTMDELDNFPGPSCSSNPPDKTSSSNYLFESKYNNRPDYSSKTKHELQVHLLTRVREVKMKEQQGGNGFKHVGYKCDYCGLEPIIEHRWTCTTCLNSVDFCTDCVISQAFTTNCHPLTHHLEAFRNNTDVFIFSQSQKTPYKESSSFKIAESDSDDTSETSYQFECLGSGEIKEENEEGLGTDEESMNNFDIYDNK